MKTIIYSLIAIFIIGIMVTGLSTPSKSTHKILIRSNDSNISTAALSKSAEIIAKRLKSYSSGKFEITLLPDKGQIQLIVTGACDLKTTGRLITQKGALEFYETLNYKTLSGLIKDNGLLLSLMQDKASSDSSAQIGCTSISEINKVNAYLNSAGLDQKCKFAWSIQFDNSNVCLYALKLNNGNGVLLKGSDVESFNSEYEKVLKRTSIGIKFKTSAIASWANITKRNLNSYIAIVVDGNVISAPSVRSEITGGNCQITGDFTAEEVKYIVTICANGELPESFSIIK
jgi:preprotein translocase subunit SecD